MKVYEALARGFAAEGVRAIFGMIGDGNMYWRSALAAHPSVNVYEARFEGSALAMADAWARTTGEPGVCTVTCGPGLTQLATSLLVASRAHTPLVVFAGAAPTGDLEYVQRFDQERFAAAAEAGFIRVTVPDAAFDSVRAAFYRARVESRPIVLDAPMDIQQLATEADEVEPAAKLFPVRSPRPDAELLGDAARLIGESQRPVIIAGRGAVHAGAREAIVQLGERSGALLATSLAAKNLFAGVPFEAGVAGLFATRAATELFAEADCVIAVGASLNYFTTEHGYLFPNARYVHIDRQPYLLMSGGRAADVYLAGDARGVVEALLGALDEADVPSSSGYRTPETLARLTAPFDRAVFEVEAGRADPREVVSVLDDLLPESVPLVLGTGHSMAFPTMHMRRPRQVFASVDFGCIGQTLGNGVGMSLALGSNGMGMPVVIVDGDGSLLMHIQELDTAVRYRTPLCVVVLNDEALAAEYHKLDARGLDPNVASIPTPDLGMVGRAFGGRGRLVQTAEAFASAVAEYVREPRLTVIDVRVSRKVVAVPYRRMYFGQDDA